jgi:hypothetical protein
VLLSMLFRVPDEVREALADLRDDSDLAQVLGS